MRATYLLQERPDHTHTWELPSTTSLTYWSVGVKSPTVVLMKADIALLVCV